MSVITLEGTWGCYSITSVLTILLYLLMLQFFVYNATQDCILHWVTSFLKMGFTLLITNLLYNDMLQKILVSAKCYLSAFSSKYNSRIICFLTNRCGQSFKTFEGILDCIYNCRLYIYHYVANGSYTFSWFLTKLNMSSFIGCVLHFGNSSTDDGVSLIFVRLHLIKLC